ncbi:MAG TPA: ROK family protein [Ilumatobacteraceae bacterium]|nr:ROK family protein [Ilumatobacteraceae bacterium]
MNDAAAPPAPSSPGPQLTYLAIDLSVTRLAAGVVDDAGKLIVRDRVATPSRHVWPTLARLVNRVIAAAPEGARPARCGVACPGPIDRVVGGTASALLPEWKGFPLREQLEEVAGIPVAIDSVGRAFASAEAWCGRGAGLRDFVALLVGDSVDGGVVSAGRLLDGRTGNVGQVGHLVVEPEGRSCSCGGVGCLDAYVSARAIESETNRPLRRTPPAVIETTGILLARAVASLAAIVDTTRVFVAGSVPAALGQPLLDAMARELAVRSRLPHLNGLSVIPLPAGAGGPLVGAAAIARSTHR